MPTTRSGRDTTSCSEVNKLKRKRNSVEKQSCCIKTGDTVDLSKLLFTTHRNYLFNYNLNQRVQAKELDGKVIILLFASPHESSSWRYDITHLLDIYSKLQPIGGVEIIFVAVGDDFTCQYDSQSSMHSTPHSLFLEIFYKVTWPAIPLSDIKSRKLLQTKFGISDHSSHSIIIDQRGVVLQCDATDLFCRYGAAGYPFTQERIEFLESEDNVARVQPSIKRILASAEHDYVITSKGNQVPLHNLEDKVVGLYFCADLYDKNITIELKAAYEELSRNMGDFEVVLIYPHDWWKSCGRRDDEDLFWKAFEEMPWLSLPFEDTNRTKQLQRIFEYPQEILEGQKPDPSLVIIGPQGNFAEKYGANILLGCGVSAYPFAFSNAVDSEVEMVKNLKPEMFWDLDTVFRRKNGSRVRFSQLLGKRIIVVFQNWGSSFDSLLWDLKEMYVKMKGTSDEFEVIHVHHGMRSYRVVAAMPWLIHIPFNEDSFGHKFIDDAFRGVNSGLLAFDRDGSVVRRALWPAVGEEVFPFHVYGDLENEVFADLIRKINIPLDPEVLEFL
ncbi:putative nucleoredoxin 2 [Apium graveolens]|uniref:putative nucleoredoxin 2 n=1 Tax=Apium graveolens TaxID=4045 RepID=UPI003D7BD629